MKEKHNGWTNYATWRINLEVIDGIEIETKTCAATIQEIIEDAVFSQYELGNGFVKALVEDYARAFVSEVNFYEIAQSINERLDEQD
jgi:hypothetical protein|tara:strand:- start:373 stop:633 length:261 start_codon:yes stop_codon:yes gene_type:complete